MNASMLSKTFPGMRGDCKVAGESQTQNAESEEVDLNSNATLRYISQLLLEEGTDEISSYEEELALLATERAFGDILRQEYYSTPDEPLLHNAANQMMSSVDGSNCKSSNDNVSRKSTKDGVGYDLYSVKPPIGSADLASSLPIENHTIEHIQKGIDEAMKFLPNIGEFFTDGCNRSIRGRDWLSRTKKNPSYSDLDQLMGRVPKQIAAYSEEPIRNENFDKVLLLEGQKYIEEDSILRKIMQMEMRDHSRTSRAESSKYTMKQDEDPTTEKTVDLRSLLIDCSHAISVNDHSMANELIYKIRKHSSPNGDSSQRLAYHFANGLEARLAGTASEIYRKILPEKVNVVEFLKAFRMYLAISPFMRALVYFNNQTILNNISKNTQKVHIITYGIIHGFQWPSFFEHFSTWENTPPTIRITVIEVPEPGFRPRKRVELIGRRLTDYAKSFNVPVEYEGIASKWEDVKVEDLKITDDEIIIVSCIVHSERLSDEIVGTDSPRDVFLNTIRKIRPCKFIHVTFNGSYNSAYFPARFRAALSVHSTFFEMLDSNLPRDNPERLILEKNVLMPIPFNAIAFEGLDRVERPETYKQWHARKLRAGLVPLPVDPMIKKNIKDFVREHYHRDFVIDDDNGWLLLGWKGRILYGLTTWKASEELKQYSDV